MKILVSAGPTREYMDPVRFISNPSTGRMGYLIAEECVKNGHEVTLVSGPTHLEPPKGVKIFHVETAIQMLEAILSAFPKSHMLIMTAAVSDWKPHKKNSQKIKQKNTWKLKLIPNPDILKEVARIRKQQIVIGFALETDNMIRNAEKKMKEKKLDLIVADTPDFFTEKPSRTIFVHGDGRIEKFRRMKKEDVARKIIEFIRGLK